MVVLTTVLVLMRFGPALALLVGFALLTPLELWFRRHDQRVRRPGLRTDVLHFLFTGLLRNVATLAGVLAVYGLLSRLTIPWTAEWLSARSPLVQFGLLLLVFELFGYWYHRMSHTVPFLWRLHAVHHSSEHLDWISAARLHPFEGFFQGLVIGPPLVLLGFQPVGVPVVGVALTLWAILLHANIDWRLRRLDGLIGTPEYHHWHHSNEPQARNKNFSALLPVLDRAFGTYYQPTHRRPVVYGIDGTVPDSWIGQLAAPLRRERPPVLEPF